jgi:hypothetical protein
MGMTILIPSAPFAPSLALSLSTGPLSKRSTPPMRILKFIGVVAMLAAFSAISVGTASASLLPGTKGTTVTGSSKKATLQVKGGAAITCKESKTEKGEVLSTLESLAIINFGNNCTAGGLPVKSTGDASGTILVHVEVTDCPTGLVIIAILPLTLEVPSTKLTLEIRGSVIAPVTPFGTKSKSFTLTLKQAGGVNAVTECENKEKHILETSTDKGAFIQSGQEAEEAKLEFGAEETFMT